MAQTLPQFDYLRNKAQQQSTVQSQQEEEALKRRLATTGALNTGAAVKQQGIQSDNAIARREQALQDIDFQEQAAKQQQDEIEKGRQFQTSERMGSQGFASEQAGLGRQFQTSERLGSQQFGTSERLGSQGFASAQQTGQQQFVSGESAIDRAARLASEQATMKQQQDQFTETNDLAKQAQAAKERIDQATLSLATDQADIDMITQAQNAGVAALGEDASPDAIQAYARGFEAIVAQMKKKRELAATGQVSGVSDNGTTSSTIDRDESREK